jgi:prolyl-tRNA synthetase
MMAQEVGLDVIYDDREASAGFKFADADLCGFPYRIIVGKKVKEGKVELHNRHTGEKTDVPVESAIQVVKELIDKDKV